MEHTGFDLASSLCAFCLQADFYFYFFSLLFRHFSHCNHRVFSDVFADWGLCSWQTPPSQQEIMFLHGCLLGWAKQETCWGRDGSSVWGIAWFPHQSQFVCTKDIDRQTGSSEAIFRWPARRRGFEAGGKTDAHPSVFRPKLWMPLVCQDQPLLHRSSFSCLKLSVFMSFQPYLHKNGCFLFT